MSAAEWARELLATQWDGTDGCAEALYEWTLCVVSRNEDGSPHAVATQFMFLGDAKDARREALVMLAASIAADSAERGES